MLTDGYGKIFKQIYAGTLRANWKALITFEQLIVLCDPNGVIDMPHEVLHNITGIPLDIIRDGITALESPDPRSRSADHEGRRILRLDDHRDWGWAIVNHKFYRDLATREGKREADRIRISAKRCESKSLNDNDVATCRGMSQKSQKSPTQTQTQTQTHKTSLSVHGLDESAWERFVEYRKQVGKSIKPASVTAAQKKLAAFGSDQAAVVEQTIANGWQGLFALKDKPTGGNFRNEAREPVDNSAIGKVRRANNPGAGSIIEGSARRSD